MIVWRGRGIVVALIAFGCLVLTELTTGSIFRDNRYYQVHGWPKLVGFWVAAGLVYMLQSWLSHTQPGTSLDRDNGKEMQIRSESSLFHIPIRFWPIILLGLGVAFFFVRE